MEKSKTKILITIVVVISLVIISLIVWLFSGPESGVKMVNEMDKYALEHIEEHNLLNDSEELLSYYDATISMDGSEAAILTTERVIYYKDNRITAIELKDIDDVQLRNEGMIGDIIEVKDKSGKYIKIEIAPWNLGESFYNVLMSAWDNVK